MKISRLLVIILYIQTINLMLPKYLSSSSIIDDEFVTKYLNTLLVITLVLAALILLISFISFINAMHLYKKQDLDALRKSMTTVKLFSIPFYFVNLIYSAVISVVLAIALMGIGVFFAPIAIAYFCGIVFWSGFYGIFYIRLLRKNSIPLEKPSKIHYLLQIIPALDVISTIILIIKFRKSKTIITN